MHAVFKVVLLSHMVWCCGGDISDVDMAAILSDMTTQCPFVDVCGTTGGGETNSSTETNNCCIGCSCDEACHDGAVTCCFDETTRAETHAPSPSVCLKPSLHQSMLLARYRFISSPPIDGCKQEDDHSACNIDITVQPLWDFLPVYSKSLDKNFVNKQCAICHGATPADIESWRSKAIFTGFDEELFVSSMTAFYETFNSSDNVVVIFEAPSNASISVEKHCFDEIDTCIFDEFYIPSSVHLTKTMVASACAEGPRALYIRNQTHAYNNVYCAICDRFGDKINDVIECSTSGIRKRNMMSFTFLVDFDSSFLKSSTPATKGVKKTDTCFRHKDQLNVSRCVQPNCPVLQSRIADGSCGYPGDIIIGCLHVALNLSTVQTIVTSGISNLTSAERLAMFEEHIPWSNYWRIAVVTDSTSRGTTEFHVGLSFRTNRSFSLRQLTLGIQRSMSKLWRVRINDDTVDFPQGFLSHYEKDPVSIYIGRDRFDRFCPTITKMNYCQQVELRPDEYEFDDEKVLRLAYSGRVLYTYEYTLITADGDGSEKIRVCLEDSGYIRINSANIGIRTPFEATIVPQLMAVLLALIFVI